MASTFTPDLTASPADSLMGTLRGHDYATLSVRSVNPKIFILQKEIAPIYTVLKNMPRGARVRQVKHEWNERETLPHTTAINNVAGYSNSDLTFVVDDEQYAHVGAFALFQRTDGYEIVGPIESVSTGGSTFTIVSGGRAERGTSAEAVPDNTPVIFLRGTLAEGATAANPIVTLPANKYNYVEGVSTTYGVTEMFEASDTYANANKMSDLRPLKMKDHMEEWEKRIHYGIRSLTDPGTGRPIYTMGGLINQYITSTIETVTAAPETFSQIEWEVFIGRLFNYNTSSAEKTVFGSAEILRVIDSFKYEKLRLDPEDLMFSVKANSYQSSFGTVHMIHDRFLSAAYGHAWTAVALDLQNVALRPYEPQVVKTGRPTNFAHETMEEIYESNTLEVMNQETHGIFKVRTS